MQIQLGFVESDKPTVRRCPVRRGSFDASCGVGESRDEVRREGVAPPFEVPSPLVPPQSARVRPAGSLGGAVERIDEPAPQIEGAVWVSQGHAHPDAGQEPLHGGADLGYGGELVVLVGGERLLHAKTSAQIRQAPRAAPTGREGVSLGDVHLSTAGQVPQAPQVVAQALLDPHSWDVGVGRTADEAEGDVVAGIDDQHEVIESGGDDRAVRADLPHPPAQSRRGQRSVVEAGKGQQGA